MFSLSRSRGLFDSHLEPFACSLRRAQSLILALLLAASLVRYDSALPPLDLRYVSLTTQPRLLLPPFSGSSAARRVASKIEISHPCP